MFFQLHFSLWFNPPFFRFSITFKYSSIFLIPSFSFFANCGLVWFGLVWLHFFMFADIGGTATNWRNRFLSFDFIDDKFRSTIKPKVDEISINWKQPFLQKSLKTSRTPSVNQIRSFLKDPMPRWHSNQTFNASQEICFFSEYFFPLFCDEW